MTLPFVAAAAAKLEAIIRRYELERAGLGRRFRDEVSRRVARAARFPRSGPLVRGFAPSREVRAFLLRRFPYRILVARVAEQRTVVAVAPLPRALLRPTPAEMIPSGTQSCCVSCGPLAADSTRLHDGAPNRLSLELNARRHKSCLVLAG
jgi:hypothetical protein